MLRKICLSALWLLLLSGCSLSLLREPAPTSQILPTLRVTPDDIARAMQQDSFFSEYGHAILQVHGTVAAVTRTGSSARVELQTSRPFKVFCATTSDTRQIKTGDTIIVQSSDGQREDGAVLLRECKILS